LYASQEDLPRLTRLSSFTSGMWLAIFPDMEKTVPSARVYLDFGVAWRNTLKSAILVMSDAGSFAALSRGVK